MNFDWMWPLQYSFTIDFIWIDRLKTMRWCDWFSLKFILYDPIKMLLYSSILHSIGKFKRLFIRFFASVAQFQFFFHRLQMSCSTHHTFQSFISTANTIAWFDFEIYLCKCFCDLLHEIFIEQLKSEQWIFCRKAFLCVCGKFEIGSHLKSSHD